MIIYIKGHIYQWLPRKINVILLIWLMGYDWKQANPLKNWEDCQKSSVIKLVLGVNKFVLLQLLGQSICQTSWFLFYFGQLRLPISKTKIYLGRYDLGLTINKKLRLKLKPYVVEKKLKLFSVLWKVHLFATKFWQFGHFACARLHTSFDQKCMVPKRSHKVGSTVFWSTAF